MQICWRTPAFSASAENKIFRRFARRIFNTFFTFPLLRAAAIHIIIVVIKSGRLADFYLALSDAARTLHRGQEISAIAAVRSGRSYARLRRAALIRLLFSDKPKTKSTFPKREGLHSVGAVRTLHRGQEIPAIAAVRSGRSYARLRRVALIRLLFSDKPKTKSTFPKREGLHSVGAVRTLHRGQEIPAIAAARSGRSYARLRRAALIRLLFSDKPKTKSTFPKGEGLRAIAAVRTLHRGGQKA